MYHVATYLLAMACCAVVFAAYTHNYTCSADVFEYLFQSILLPLLFYLLIVYTQKRTKKTLQTKSKKGIWSCGL